MILYTGILSQFDKCSVLHTRVGWSLAQGEILRWRIYGHTKLFQQDIAYFGHIFQTVQQTNFGSHFGCTDVWLDVHLSTAFVWNDWDGFPTKTQQYTLAVGATGHDPQVKDTFRELWLIPMELWSLKSMDQCLYWSQLASASERCD